MNNQYTPEERAWRWIKFGVIPSFFPLILAIAYDIYLEFTFSQILSRHFLDLILVVFAIAVSIISSAADLNNTVNGKLKEKYIYTAIFLCGICCSIYGFLYSRDEGNIEFLTVLRIVLCYSAFKIVQIGFNLELEGAKSQNNNSSPNSPSSTPSGTP